MKHSNKFRKVGHRRVEKEWRLIRKEHYHTVSLLQLFLNMAIWAKPQGNLASTFTPSNESLLWIWRY